MLFSQTYCNGLTPTWDPKRDGKNAWKKLLKRSIEVKVISANMVWKNGVEGPEWNWGSIIDDRERWEKYAKPFFVSFSIVFLSSNNGYMNIK